MARSRKARKSGVLSALQIQNKYPGAGLASEISFDGDNSLWLPSRCIPLNYAMGGGIPYGKILELYGMESSGKTLIALDFGSVAQSLGGVVLMNDAEMAFTKAWAIKNGLDPSKIHLYQETAVEPVSDWLMDTALSLRSRLTNNEPILFIQDSVAALDCLANINSSQADAKAEMGNRAKAIYKMVRIRNQMLSELGVNSIFINQIRSNISAAKNRFSGQDPDTTPGGQAMKFYASIRVGVYGGRQIKEKVNGFEDRVGAETSVRIKKNKVAPPRPTFKAKMFFNPDYEPKPLGLDRYFGLGEILIKTGVLSRKTGSSLIYYEGELVARSEAGLDAKLEKDGKLRRKLIEASGINTVSKTRKAIENTTHNLFPVRTRKFTSQTEANDDE